MKCLLADDNRVNQIIGSKILEKHGFTVAVVSNGQDAIYQLQAIRYDLVFMDCQMPVLDGYEATKAIRRLPRDHFNYNIPILALTGHGSSRNYNECILSGMNARLSKPIDEFELKEVIVKLTPQLELRRNRYVEAQRKAKLLAKAKLRL
jgi:CheY-like chemotaxis protein